MKFDILTLFPEMFEAVKQSIIGKAIEKQLIQINLINIRDFSKDKHKKVDDTPYGGGAGMVMMPDVVYDAYSSIQNKENAMQMLASKLLELRQREHEKKLAELKGENFDINFGSQIRSYVFHPYKMVKDHRTGFEMGNVDAVMDGELDGFIEAYLKSK